MKNILNYFSRGFVGLYAILTVIAAISDIRTNGFHYWHLFYFVGAVLLAAAGISNSQVLMTISLVAMIAIAMYNGYVTGTLQWSHIAVRTIISLIIGALHYYSIH